MANKRASISAHLRADASQWQRGCDTARAATERLKRDVEKVKIDGPKANFSGLKSTVGGLAAGFSAAAAAAAVFKGEMNAEGLARSLSALDRGTETLKTQMQELVKLAEKPGVGSMNTAARGVIEFQNMGFEADEARKAVKALGNEAAVLSLPEEDLQAVIVSLRQMSTTSVDMQNLKEILSRMPRLSTMMDGLDKSNPMGFIKGLIQRMSEMPKAVAGVKEKVDGLKDSVQQFVSTAGGGVLSNTIGNLADAGRALLKGDLGGVGQGLYNIGGDMGAGISSPLERFEKSDAERAAIRAKLKEQERQKEIKARQEQLDILREMGEEDADAYALAGARAMQDDATVASLEDQAEVQRRINALKETGRKVDEDIVDAIQKQVAQRREDLNVIREAQAMKAAADERDKAAVDRLRHMGRNRQADKLEDKQEVDRLVKGGMKKDEAERLVNERRDMAQDQALGPGRRRLRTKAGAPRPWSLPERNAVPLPEADNIPAKPTKPTPPANNNPRSKGGDNPSSGLGQDFGRMLKVLEEIRTNTKPQPSEVQQGQRRSQQAA